MGSSTPPRRQRTEAATPRAPTPEELAVIPELALLDALQHILDLTTRTLVAMHPDLVGDRSYLRPLDPQALVADKLITLGIRLAKVVVGYRVAALASLHSPDTDDLPF